MSTTHTSAAAGNSQCDIILDSLKAQQGTWVSMLHLHLLSGSMAVHSRIADLRARGHIIEQRNVRKGRMIHSSYRLVDSSQPLLFP